MTSKCFNCGADAKWLTPLGYKICTGCKPHVVQGKKSSRLPKQTLNLDTLSPTTLREIYNDTLEALETATEQEAEALHAQASALHDTYYELTGQRIWAAL